MGTYLLKSSKNKRNKQLSICLPKKKLPKRVLDKIKSGKRVRVKIW